MPTATTTADPRLLAPDFAARFSAIIAQLIGFIALRLGRHPRLAALTPPGMLAEVLPNVVQGYGVHYYSWTNQLFAKIEPSSREYGYPKRNAFRQQLLVQALSQGMTRQASVSLRYGHELDITL
jgi:hypothetical protein